MAEAGVAVAGGAGGLAAAFAATAFTASTASSCAVTRAGETSTPRVLPVDEVKVTANPFLFARR